MLIRDVKLIIFSWGCAYAVCDRRFLFSTFSPLLLPICICFYFFGGKRKRFESHAQAVSIMRDLGCRDLRDPRISHADNCEEIKFRIALIFNCRDLILFGFRWQMAIWRGFEDLFRKTWSDNDLSR